MTPLHKAAENGHLKIVEILLSKGAELDSRDKVSIYNNVMSLGFRIPYGRKLWRSKSFANLQLWIFGKKYFGESVIIGNIAVDSQIFLIQVL